VHQLAGDDRGRHSKGLGRLEDSLGMLLGQPYWRIFSSSSSENTPGVRNWV
jgi:hypothetical protein